MLRQAFIRRGLSVSPYCGAAKLAYKRLRIATMTGGRELPPVCAATRRCRVKKVLQAQAIALLAAAAVCGGALAQDLGDVTVQASNVERSEIGKSSSRIPLLALSVTHVISAADLDLRTSEGMSKLQDRVEEAAEHGCREISMAYRNAKPNDQTCARQATSETMARVRELLAAG